MSIFIMWSSLEQILPPPPGKVTIPMLFKTVLSGKLQPGQLITHTFALKDGLRAYETFGNAMKESALKVLITAG